MVNATKGVFISCYCMRQPYYARPLKSYPHQCQSNDIPMAQFVINMNASLPNNQKFIIRVLDNTHLFVQPHAAEMIRTAVSEYRDQNTYEKPS